MYFYVNGEKGKPQDAAMFWSAALTRAKDMLKSGEIGDGDVYTIRSISDVGKLDEAVGDAVNELSPKYGKTAEFGLWSHGALDGPRGSSPTSGEYALDKTFMQFEGWGNINFNWKNDGLGAKAMFFGCRTAAAENDAGEAVTPWTQVISLGSNMKNVEVWGQTMRSWPSMYPDMGKTTPGMRTDSHGVPTYMVGSTKSLFYRFDRNIGKPYHGYPMGVYQNGQFLRTSYQFWQKR